MQVIFIYGPAASGKFTIGCELSEKLGIPLFHNHLTVDLVTTLFEFGSDGFKELRREIWQNSFAAAAKAGQSFVFTFHPEATVQEDLVSSLQQIVEENGGAVQYIELMCSDGEVLKRLANPDRSAHGKLQDTRLYQQLRNDGQFDYQGVPKADFTIDTESVSATEAAEKIIRFLQQ